MRHEQFIGRIITAGLIMAGTAGCDGAGTQSASGQGQGKQDKLVCQKAKIGDTVLGILGNYDEDATSPVELHRGLHTTRKPGVEQLGLEPGDSICFVDHQPNQTNQDQ